MRTMFSCGRWAALLTGSAVQAADALVAVAAIFMTPVEKMAPAFKKTVGVVMGTYDLVLPGDVATHSREPA